MVKSIIDFSGMAATNFYICVVYVCLSLNLDLTCLFVFRQMCIECVLESFVCLRLSSLSQSCLSLFLFSDLKLSQSSQNLFLNKYSFSFLEIQPTHPSLLPLSTCRILDTNFLWFVSISFSFLHRNYYCTCLV